RPRCVRIEHVVARGLFGRVLKILPHIEHASDVDDSEQQGKQHRSKDGEFDNRAAAAIRDQVGELVHRRHAYGQIMMTVAVVVAGTDHLPKLPKFNDAPSSADAKDLAAVTLTYFFGVLPS